MKKIITLTIVALLSIYFIACGKVHNAPSQLRITSVGIVDGKNQNAQNGVSWTTGVDIYQGVCYDPDDPVDCSGEPFYDSYVNMAIRNYFTFNVTLTHYFYVIKNYFGNGNDYISPNLGLMGNTFLPGNKVNATDQNTNGNNVSQEIINAIFLPVGGIGRYFPGSREVIQNMGTFNVVFYVYGRGDNGDEVVATNMTSISLTDYDKCEGDNVYSDHCPNI